jgi:salicylate hydroxylase
VLAGRKLDIAIAGAGPGGLAAALALKALGHRVVVYEQFNQPKPVGSGLILQPTGLSVLDWLGLGDGIRTLGARIDRLYGTASGSGKTVLDVRYAALGRERGLAVHRAALFNVLYEAVKSAGIGIENNSQIMGLQDRSLVMVKQRLVGPFDLVIDALGARSPLVPQRKSTALSYGAVWASLPWPEAGFDPHALAQVYDKASVMIGVLPIGRTVENGPLQAAFFWSLKTNSYEAWKQRGLAAWKDDVLRHWPAASALLDNIQSTDDLVLARYQHHTMARPYGANIIHIGDSAHATSPQLGQGANMALLDVRALAQAFSQTDDIAEVSMLYARMRKRHVRVYQALSMMFTPFYQSDSVALPWLRDNLVSSLSRIGPAQKILARMVAGTLVKPMVGRDVERRVSTSP